MARIVLDASVLIALVDGRDGHHHWARQFFRNTLEHDLLMSVVSYAEVCVQPFAAGRQRDFERSIGGLGLEVIGLDGDDAAPLARLRAETRLRMPDAIVLGTAIAETADVATCDTRLARAAEARGVRCWSPRPAATE